MAAENYHLKWDSHLSYLNTSIATLYKNEKFADVMLYSSYSNSAINSDIPTVGISAHKFILSSCSQFFATMFETAPITAPNGVLYIVLPPDLSHRAIQILVQYMYSGEATVSNDILNEVLRGGEILKIRGLCRTGSSSSSGSSHGHHLHHQRESSAMYVSNGTRSSLAPPPPMSTQLPADIYSNKPGSSSNSGSARYTLEHLHTNSHQPQQQHHHLHHHHQQQFRGLGASVMPKDSPVIVKSPKIAPHTGLLSVAGSSKLHGISVNKEVAIDPEDKCCYAAATQVESLPQSTGASTVTAPPPPPPPPPPPGMTICTEVGCNSCPLAAPSNESADSTLRRSDYERDREEQLCDRERDDVGLVYDRRLRREHSCERAPAHEYFDGPHYEQHVVKSYEVSVAPRLATPPQHPHSFLTIKQEPTDWSNNPTSSSMSNDNHHEHSQEAPLSPKQPLDFKMNNVKLEASSTPPDDAEEHTLRDYNNFKLLVCEICQKSFEDTKMLVRHLGTHAAEPASGGGPRDQGGPGSSSSSSGNATASSNLALRALKTYVPKKRRRVSQQENNMDHVTLLCDLCTTSFDTPAEWVRHMNSQHTEIELAMFNSKKDGEQKGQMQDTASKKYVNANRQGSRSSSHHGHGNGNGGAAASTTTASPSGLAVVASSSQA